MNKQYFLGQEMASLNEVMDCIKDWQSQGCRFVFEMDGKVSPKGTLVYRFITYGDLPENMAPYVYDDEELWKDTKEYQQLKASWESEYGKQQDYKREVCRVYATQGVVIKAVMDALDKAEVMHGEAMKADPKKATGWYVNVPNDGGAHYLEELINMNCASFAIEKFTIKEFTF